MPGRKPNPQMQIRALPGDTQHLCVWTTWLPGHTASLDKPGTRSGSRFRPAGCGAHLSSARDTAALSGASVPVPWAGPRLWKARTRSFFTHSTSPIPSLKALLFPNSQCVSATPVRRPSRAAPSLGASPGKWGQRLCLAGCCDTSPAAVLVPVGVTLVPPP